MSMSLGMSVKLDGLSDLTKQTMELPGLFERARKSALGSLGYHIMRETRDYVESGGSGWAAVSPITKKLRKSYKSKAALYWLGRFARYQVNQDGSQLQVGFGKGQTSSKGVFNPRRFDPQLDEMVQRHEYGESTTATRRTQARIAAATKSKSRAKKKKLGKNYYTIKAGTRINVPARPMIGPVLQRVEPKAGALFEEKFWGAMERYRSGVAKR